MKNALAILTLALATAWQLGAQQPMPAPRTLQEFDALFNKISNWGRWGKDDQLGAANLVTGAKRRQAAALVKNGIVVSLAREMSRDQSSDNPGPAGYTMNKPGAEDVASDAFRMGGHSLTMTHVDTFCHIGYKGRLYNGHKMTEVATDAGCTMLGLGTFKNGIITRGILMDIPRLKGLPYLEPGTPIFAEDLEAWERRAGVTVTSGDAVFVRTGRWARHAKLGPWEFFKPSGSNAGLHPSVAAWFRARDVAFVGNDVPDGYQPLTFEGVPYPLHTLLLTALGVDIFDAVDLEQLSESAERLRRWDFMLTAAPLPIQGGTGSPINPIAIF